MTSPVSPLISASPAEGAVPAAEAVFPLSFAQERLWFIDQLIPGSAVYNIPLVWRGKGELNVGALRQALTDLVARHEPLRAVMESHAGQPRQRILPAAPVALPELDLRMIPPEEREAVAWARVEEAARRPFNLREGGLLRALLLRLNDQEWILVLSIHHIAWDGWSVPILYRELTEGYAAALRGEPWRPAPLPVTFHEHVQREREEWRGERLQEELDWWRDRLAGAPEATTVMDAETRRPTAAARGGWQTLTLPDAVFRTLQEFSRRQGCSLHMLLLAAWFVLLARWTGQTDLVVGSPAANRSDPALFGLMGLFINMVALRCELSGDPPFQQVLAQVRGQVLDVVEHQQLPFEKLVEALHPDRGAGLSPLFQTVFMLQNQRPRTLRLEGMEMELLPVETGTAKYDLMLIAEDKADVGQGFELGVEYNLDLLSREEAAALLGGYRTLLTGIAANPAARLHELPLLEEAGQRERLQAGQGARSPYPQCGINELFEKQAARRPDGGALEWTGGKMTYRELEAGANQLAWGLRRQGVSPGSVVGVCLERSPELVMAMLGVLKAGAAYLPFSPEEPAERRNPLLLNAGVQMVVAGVNYCHDLPGSIPARSPRQLRHGQSELRLCLPVSPDHLACVLSTSGSTGTPKGVEIPHRGIVRMLMGADYMHLDENEVFLHLSAMSFDATSFEVWGPLLHGGRCVLYPARTPAPREVAEMVRRHHVTTLWLTASLFNEVVDEAPHAFAGVRQLLAGGEALSVEHVRRVMQLYPHIRMINGYGPTESSTFTCCYTVPEVPPAEARSIPIGPPIANTDVYVLDEYRQLQPVGVAGELYIGGDGLARGYRNQPERTAERFVANPFDPGGRLYRSGDRVRWRPEGTLEFLGRIDQQIKLRGFRIEPGEVETVLAGLPGIERAAVDVRGEGSGRRLVAWLVTGSPLDAERIRRALRARLPQFMIPAQFVRMERLPLTPQGKLDRRALPDPEGRAAGNAPPARPYSPEEVRLERIWASLLGVEQVRPEENFFDLGGHSLLAGRLLARVEQQFGVRLTMASLFELPTLEAMAAELALRQPKRWLPPLIPLQTQGEATPFFCVGAGPFFRPLAHRLGPGRPFLGIDLGNDHQLQPPYRFEDIGAAVARVICQRQPEGPIDLGGWCLHGVAAYEAACQLARQGREVRSLVLFDAPHPSFWRGRTFGPARAAYHLRRAAAASPRQLLELLRERMQGGGFRLQTRLWTGVYRLHCGLHLRPRGWFRDMLQVLYFTARHYYPAAREGTTVLFRSRERPGGRGATPDFGWGPLLGERLVVREIPGDHRSIFQEPSVSTLAAALQECWMGVAGDTGLPPEPVRQLSRS